MVNICDAFKLLFEMKWFYFCKKTPSQMFGLNKYFINIKLGLVGFHLGDKNTYAKNKSNRLIPTVFYYCKV